MNEENEREKKEKKHKSDNVIAVSRVICCCAGIIRLRRGEYGRSQWRPGGK